MTRFYGDFNDNPAHMQGNTERILTDRKIFVCYPRSAMHTAPNSNGNFVLRPRRRPSGFASIPLALKLLLGLSLAIMVAIPLLPHLRHSVVRTEDSRPLSVLPSADLVLGRAEFDIPTRKVKGVLENNSNTEYKDVVVSYRMKDSKGGDVGAVSATMQRIAPHGRVDFATEPMPTEAFSYDLREIVGDPVRVASR